jgi:osmotically-inducible protein OsmY
LTVLAPSLPPVAQIVAVPDGRATHQTSRQEVVVTGTRASDAALTEQVTQVLEDDPYLYNGHISVAAENGVVTLQGVVQDLGDYRRALLLARRIAGRGRVVNKMELIPEDLDKD